MVADAGKRGELYGKFLVARGGDRDALNELLEHLRPIILRGVRNRVRSAACAEAVAEELTQDVLLRVTEGLAGCRALSEAQLLAWTRTIARRVVIDWRRRRAHEHGRRTPGGLAAPDTRAPVAGLLPPYEPGTQGDSEVDHVLGQILMEAQEALSPGTQRVLVGRLLYGDTWRAAGCRAGTSAGGAKRRYQRAVARLHREVLLRVRQVENEDLRRALLAKLGEDAAGTGLAGT